MKLEETWNGVFVTMYLCSDDTKSIGLYLSSIKNQVQHWIIGPKLVSCSSKQKKNTWTCSSKSICHTKTNNKQSTTIITIIINTVVNNRQFSLQVSRARWFFCGWLWLDGWVVKWTFKDEWESIFGWQVINDHLSLLNFNSIGMRQ